MSYYTVKKVIKIQEKQTDKLLADGIQQRKLPYNRNNKRNVCIDECMKCMYWEEPNWGDQCGKGPWILDP